MTNLKEDLYQVLLKRVGDVTYPKRLYPVRLYVLGRHIGIDVARLIEQVILIPLSRSATCDYWRPPYFFNPSTFGNEVVGPFPPGTADYCHQFTSDVGVYGLQEAVVYLHDGDFQSNPYPLLEGAIGLTAMLAYLYGLHEEAMRTSSDPVVRGCMAQAEAYSE